jgi:hypothetical protein
MAGPEKSPPHSVEAGFNPAPTEPGGEGTFKDELARIPYEPLLPVEKQLIAWSLLLGVALLGLLVWVSNRYFPP